MNIAEQHRQHVQRAIETTYEHQRIAAKKTFDKFSAGARAVVVAAEMQSGKSGIALVLAGLQRLALSDEAICDRKRLKDTLYLVTMADVALQEQAKRDLAPTPNIVISNFANFESALVTDFKHQAPKLIIIDECHYGSHIEAIRYSRVFDYIEKENTECCIVFISATPFSALYSAGADSILRHNFHTKLVFHKTGSDYHGIREMHRHNQLIKLSEDQRDFCDDSLLQKRFIRQFMEHEGPGWSLIRVPSSQAKTAKQVLMAHGIAEEQIYIIGQKLVGVAEHELCSIDDFKSEYETAAMFDDKLIAITVAGFRAGVNFGQNMKESLINTWDSTVANIAAVVQANVGRACGYHQNTQAKHFTNLDAVRAYSDLLDHLEAKDDSEDFEGLHQLFEDICDKYQVRGFDRGTMIAPEPQVQLTKKLDDSATYLTKGYIAVPAKLSCIDADFSAYTSDPEVLEAIQLIRGEFLAEGTPYPKSGRAMKGDDKNWIKAQWVNGVTYDDYTPSCAKSRAIDFTAKLNDGIEVEFNQVVNPGGGEITADKRVMATIFSTYNLSRKKDAFKRAMDADDMTEICQVLGCEYDNTLILLYQRGEFSQSLTDQKRQDPIQISKIRSDSIFK
ncbi:MULTISPECIES: DEAD/DEAH box helicase family protein [Shewanella]|uniref:DEAD/DEAH box helicase family protein n=1 Tax=Shewanella TaxID=22 RepID=UPI00030DF58C|nr:MULTISPECIES: DEAD/DEAH box helicase family protein [Shewanella]MDH1628374.1 glutathione synthase [Shewanella xiamenensis]MDV5248831.1 glutathione synthase [Shewanella xiamenensis]PWH03580.1 glutathione synthase [Shewanella xiamenensis]